MNYSIEEISGEPIITVTSFESFDLATDTARSIEDLIKVLDAQPIPVFYISDVRELRVDFSDMVGLLGGVTKGNRALFKHHNLREIIIVTDSKLVNLGAKSLGQKQYGNLPVSVFETPEEAFAYAREQSAAL